MDGPLGLVFHFYSLIILARDCIISNSDDKGIFYRPNVMGDATI